MCVIEAIIGVRIIKCNSYIDINIDILFYLIYVVEKVNIGSKADRI